MNSCFGKTFNRLEAPILWITKSSSESVTTQLGGALSVFTKLTQVRHPLQLQRSETKEEKEKSRADKSDVSKTSP